MDERLETQPSILLYWIKYNLTVGFIQNFVQLALDRHTLSIQVLLCRETKYILDTSRLKLFQVKYFSSTNGAQPVKPQLSFTA